MRVPFNNKIILIPPFCSLCHYCHSLHLYTSIHKYKYTHTIIHNWTHSWYDYFEKNFICYIKNKKNKAFFKLSLLPSSVLSLTWCRSMLLTSTIFFFSWMNFFKHLLQDRSSGNKFPQFLLVEEVLNSSSFLKHNFARHRILGCLFFFSLNTLNTSLHCLLACIVSEEKSDIILIFVPL